jgi:hypothetical protein
VIQLPAVVFTVVEILLKISKFSLFFVSTESKSKFSHI